MHIILALVLLALPLTSAAQMKCPDGTYQQRCPGGGGAAISGDSVSGYTAPPSRTSPPPRQRGSEDRQRGQQAKSGVTMSGSSGPMSTDERARELGISRNELVQARSRGTILEGMRRKDAVHILGTPSRERQSTADPACRVLYWHNRNNRLSDTIYLCNGKVYSHDEY